MATLAFVIAWIAIGLSLIAIAIAWSADVAARKAAKGERPPWPG